MLLNSSFVFFLSFMRQNKQKILNSNSTKKMIPGMMKCLLLLAIFIFGGFASDEETVVIVLLFFYQLYPFCIFWQEIIILPTKIYTFEKTLMINVVQKKNLTSNFVLILHPIVYYKNSKKQVFFPPILGVVLIFYPKSTMKLNEKIASILSFWYAVKNMNRNLTWKDQNKVQPFLANFLPLWITFCLIVVETWYLQLSPWPKISRGFAIFSIWRSFRAHVHAFCVQKNLKFWVEGWYPRL